MAFATASAMSSASTSSFISLVPAFLALISKEAAYVLPVLLLVVADHPFAKATLRRVAPFAALTAAGVHVRTYAADASLYIQAIEKRQGLMVACPEEIAFRSGYITADQVEKIGNLMKNNSYGAYLLQLLREKVF